MVPYFSDYAWIEGKPYGKNPIHEQEKITFAFRIISDPYGKRISLEKYADGVFSSLVYDSLLLDFRHLKPQNARDWGKGWSRELIKESESLTVALVRNIEERVLYKEVCTFRGNFCLSCNLYSVHDIPLSCHKMYYEHLGHSFNGVVLYDSEKKPVMYKKYASDPENGLFTDLLHEEWSPADHLPLRV